MRTFERDTCLPSSDCPKEVEFPQNTPPPLLKGGQAEAMVSAREGVCLQKDFPKFWECSSLLCREKWSRGKDGLVMGPHVDQDCLHTHTSCPLFTPNPHARTWKMDLGFTGPLYLFIFQIQPVKPKSIFKKISLFLTIAVFLVLCWGWLAKPSLLGLQDPGSVPNNPGNNSGIPHGLSLLTLPSLASWGPQHRPPTLLIWVTWLHPSRLILGLDPPRKLPFLPGPFHEQSLSSVAHRGPSYLPHGEAVVCHWVISPHQF